MSGNASNCSDDSFEIVSAEFPEESESGIISMYKPSVLFQDMFDVYPVDTDIVARITFVEGYEKSPGDKVVILPIAWDSLDQGLCAAKLQGNYFKFDVKDLPKTSADKFYQLCYSSECKSVKGVSAPFSFREVHEDELMEFQKEQNKEFWTFRSRFAILMNTLWNTLVECKKTIDAHERKVILVDSAVNTPKNMESKTLPLSEDEDVIQKSEQSPNPVPESVPLSTDLENSNDSRAELTLPLSEDEDVIQKSEQSPNPVPESVPLSTDLENSNESRAELTTAEQERDAKQENSLKFSDELKIAKEERVPQVEMVESDRKTKEEYQLAKKKYEKKKKELNSELERLAGIISQHQRKRQNEEAASHELHRLRSANKELETSLKNLLTNGVPLKPAEVNNLKYENDTLRDELNLLKSKEASLQTLADDYESLKRSNQALEMELKSTREFLEYMIEQKDERLKNMATEERDGHLYVYETMKSCFKKRRGKTVEVKKRVMVERSRSDECEPSSTTQAASNDQENVPRSEESHVIDHGYENEEHRKEHVLLLRRLNAWFDNESLDGAEEIRKELRMQYVHMERVNRHLSSDVHRLKERCSELEVMFDSARKEMLQLGGKLTRKVNEKVELDKLLAHARQKLVSVAEKDISPKDYYGMVESFKRQVESAETQLKKMEEKLKEEQERNSTLNSKLNANEQSYASQIVTLTHQNQKLLDEYNIMKNDFELRLKMAAKEYAKLYVKYKKLAKPSDHTYAVPPRPHERQSTSSSRENDYPDPTPTIARDVFSLSSSSRGSDHPDTIPTVTKDIFSR